MTSPIDLTTDTPPSDVLWDAVNPGMHIGYGGGLVYAATPGAFGGVWLCRVMSGQMLIAVFTAADAHDIERGAALRHDDHVARAALLAERVGA